MTMADIINAITAEGMAGWGIIVIMIIVLSLVQISPLSLNPWDSIFRWFGRKFNGEMEDKVSDLQKQITEMWVNNHRNNILTFAREARAEIKHSSDEWTNILNQAEEYEKYVNTKKITNGIITQDTVFLRDLYQQLCREHRL